MVDITGCTNIISLDKGQSLKKFKAIYEDKDVIIRIFSHDNYYGNRYMREHEAIKTLENFNNGQYYFFDFPKIIKEYDEYQIRILEWIKGEAIGQNNIPNTILSIQKELSLVKNKTKRYIFKNDIESHLKKTHLMIAKDEKRFIQYSQHILNDLDPIYSSNSSLIHGDFYHDNFIDIKYSQKIGIIDWEYASIGSKYYDLTYLHIFSNWEAPPKIIPEINKWKPIVTANLCHWYLSFQNTKRESCDLWLNKLEKCTLNM